ncbi:MAG TPA: hypothetical protein VD864_02530, partial [Nocardioides sp.]|nr:hypothetical protein [Nocardioides sp.]
DPAELLLTVRNSAPTEAPTAGGSGGFGLIGMRERAELTGARLEHGPTAEGGWLVSLRVPRELDVEGEP